MVELAGVLLVLMAGVGVTAYSAHRIRLRRLARERIAAPAAPETASPREEAPRPGARVLRRLSWLAWLGALLLGLLLAFVLRMPTVFAVTFALIAGILLSQLEGTLHQRKISRLESQLADTIDLMVASLQAGAGVAASLETATREARAPLREHLQNLVARIRYGDDPADVFTALGLRIPLETFRLFASTLAVHAEVGGSLARTLASVGRIVRDRLEISRKIRSMTTQARASILAVLATTYFIGLVIWRNDPERMAQFLGTSIGQWLAAAAMLLQALGILWSGRISRMRY